MCIQLADGMMLHMYIRNVICVHESTCAYHTSCISSMKEGERQPRQTRRVIWDVPEYHMLY